MGMEPRSTPQTPSASPADTSLDPVETTAGDLSSLVPDWRRVRPEFACQPATRDETSFRHSGWADDRRRIFTAMLAPGIASDARLDRFLNCGSGGFFQWSPSTGEVRYSANHCHDRWCQPCQRARAAGLRSQMLAAALGEKQHLRFFTFTLRNVGQLSLADMIERLFDCWRLLRQRKEFLNHCTGGCMVPEIKLGRLGQWHVHAHCIIAGDYWPQRDVSQLWLAVTGDSSIVHVRAIPTEEERRNHVDYVLKYATKPIHHDVVCVPHLLDAAMRALHGRRLVNFFGTWKGIKEQEQPDVTDWQTIGSLAQILRRVAEREPFALAIWRAWHTSTLLDTPPPTG